MTTTADKGEQEFKREERYIVIKLSDFDNTYLAGDEIVTFHRVLEKVAKQRNQFGKSPLECAVIESDWPEYEPVWKMIEDRMAGRPTNEGQDGLINDALYLVQAFENDCVATDYWRDIEEFRNKAARHLSSKKASPAEVGSEDVQDFADNIKRRLLDMADNNDQYQQGYLWAIEAVDVAIAQYHKNSTQQSPARVEGEMTKDSERTEFYEWLNTQYPGTKSTGFDLNDMLSAWTARALNQRLAVKEGEARVGVNGGVEGEKLKVVITTDMAGRCVAVTRQNPEGQIKEVIWELSTHPAPGDQQAKDAARYRFLRAQEGRCNSCFAVSMNIGHDWITVYGDELDGAIDGAAKEYIDAALSTTKQARHEVEN